MAWTAPRTWAAAETVTAALMNTHVRDNLKAIGDPWTAYTPTWTGAGGNPVINNGTNLGAYVAAGKLIHFRITITMGSTTTYGSGNYSLTLPVAPVNIRWRFQGGAQDSGVGDWPIVGRYSGTGSTMDLVTLPTTAGNSERTVTPTVPFTFGTGDLLIVHGTYEAA